MTALLENMKEAHLINKALFLRLLTDGAALCHTLLSTEAKQSLLMCISYCEVLYHFLQVC